MSRMEFHLFVGSGDDHELVVKAKEAFEGKEEATSLVSVEGFRFSTDPFGWYFCWWQPVLPPALEELTFTAIHLEVDVDTGIPLGCHEEVDMTAWVSYITPHQVEEGRQCRRIKIYGRTFADVLRLYREILDGKRPTSPVSDTREQEA